MTKVRTVIPSNAKPGHSIIQVTNPRTGRPVRILVPKNASPGKMMELHLPDENAPQRSPSRISISSLSSGKDGESPVANSSANRFNLNYNQGGSGPTPPQQLSINTKSLASSEDDPLIKKDAPLSRSDEGCCWKVWGIMCCLSG
jgi:hypothetical protein